MNIPRFLKELAKLPPGVREKAEMIVFQQLFNENPLSLGYLEKMKGYPGKYKIRIGDYGIGLSRQGGKPDYLSTNSQ